MPAIESFLEMLPELLGTLIRIFRAKNSQVSRFNSTHDREGGEYFIWHRAGREGREDLLKVDIKRPEPGGESRGSRENHRAPDDRTQGP